MRVWVGIPADVPCGAATVSAVRSALETICESVGNQFTMETACAYADQGAVGGVAGVWDNNASAGASPRGLYVTSACAPSAATPQTETADSVVTMTALAATSLIVLLLFVGTTVALGMRRATAELPDATK